MVAVYSQAAMVAERLVVVHGLLKGCLQLGGDWASQLDFQVVQQSHSGASPVGVVTGKSERDPNIKITPARPVAASLRDLVQYAWLAAIPEAYAAEVVNKVVANLKTAQVELSQRLRPSSPAAQDGLVDRYGNHDSANRMDSVAGNVVGTLASMIQLHMNLKQWGNVDYALDIAAPELWQRVEPYNGIPGRIAAEWRKIEAVDYMPLSTIAAAMLGDSELGPQLGPTLKAVHETMSGYLQTGISATTNVVAEIWQALIPDRDQRAAYYTKPAVAELLANLTTAHLASPRKISAFATTPTRTIAKTASTPGEWNAASS